LDTSESRKEIPVKFWNVVLEKDGEDRLDRSCEKWSANCSPGGAKYRTYNNTKEGQLDWSHITQELPSNACIEGKLNGRIDVTRKRGRRRKLLLDDLKEKGGCWKLKQGALGRTLWRTRLGRGSGPVVRQKTGWSLG